MNQLIKDETGNTYGRLYVVELSASDDSGKACWVCKCKCGNITVVSGDRLRQGVTKSCGCLAIDIIGNMNKTHGFTSGGRKSPTYKSWTGMRGRCYTKTNKKYLRYGGRGIKMCDRWKDSFDNFLADIGLKPSPEHSIDRINNDGNYEPGTCRWATDIEHSRNKSTTLRIRFQGEENDLATWCEKLGLPYHRTWQRLYRLGHSVDVAFTNTL